MNRERAQSGSFISPWEFALVSLLNSHWCLTHSAISTPCRCTSDFVWFVLVEPQVSTGCDCLWLHDQRNLRLHSTSFSIGSSLALHYSSYILYRKAILWVFLYALLLWWTLLFLNYVNWHVLYMTIDWFCMSNSDFTSRKWFRHKKVISSEERDLQWDLLIHTYLKGDTKPAQRYLLSGLVYVHEVYTGGPNVEYLVPGKYQEYVLNQVYSLCKFYCMYEAIAVQHEAVGQFLLPPLLSCNYMVVTFLWGN